MKNIWQNKVLVLMRRIQCVRSCAGIEVDAAIDRGELIEPLFGRPESGCFWTVYARKRNGLLEAVADFDSRFAAQTCAKLAGLIFALPVRVWSAS